MENQTNLIKQKVNALLGQENSGHNMEHVNRVLALSLKFAKQENANSNIVSLIALLHDVDDYKLFGHKNATNLPNATHIMSEVKIDQTMQRIVLSEIKQLGYHKRIQGVHPQTPEGQIVSDADMCDGLGTHGILRTYQYGIAHNRTFFQKESHPNIRSTQDYVETNSSNTSIDHFFEKSYF